MNRTHLHVAVVLTSFCLWTPHLTSQELVVNGDFEADTFTVWPGYVGGGNPAELTGWSGQGGRGINPVFAPQNPPSVSGWTRNPDSTGNYGINPVNDPEHAAPSPFADNGQVDGHVLFMQGTISLQQEVTGLTVGTDYVLNVDYNSRNCCGDVPAVFLELNGRISDQFPNPDEFFDEVIDPVGAGPWFNVQIPIKADRDSLLIEFFSEPWAGGDATFLLDNLTLVPEAGGDDLMVNGDFDADADLWVVWPGYVGDPGGGAAPFRNNGNNDSQVALLQNSAWIEQEITGLSVGEEYILSLDYNARTCCQGDIPAPFLLLDGEVLDDFPNAIGIVEPVGGDNDWYRYEKAFVADFDSVIVRIQNEPDLGLDATLLVDNVSLRSTAVDPLDCNGDGVVNAADLECACAADVRDGVLAETGLLEGDLDGNGSVEFADFLVLSANFGASVDSYTLGDLDCNGQVAFADFLVLSANFGQSASATAAVPEPAGLGLVWMALIPILSFRAGSRQWIESSRKRSRRIW